MSPDVVFFVILLICNTYLLSSDSHVCETGNTCSGSTVRCKSGEACDVTCRNNKKCQSTDIFCPDNYQCVISCNGTLGCDYANIDGRSSSELAITCNGVDTCSNIWVYCPPNDAGIKKCSITADGNLFGNGAAGADLKFYAVDGWNDLNIAYTGGYYGDIRYQTMVCLSDYSASCRIPDGLWECEHSNDVCDNSPIPETTTDPTTIQPTTFLPSTSIPTTSIPTTSIPTTSIPTTSIPSTSIPSTSNPSTSIPTSSNPTTSPSTNTVTTSVSTNIPISSSSTSPSYMPTVSPAKSGKISEQWTTVDSEGTKQPLKESIGSYYILYAVVGFLIVFMIICCVFVFIWKRKKYVEQNKVDTSNMEINNVSSNKDIGTYDAVLDQSPMSIVNGADFCNNKSNKEVESMGEIQLAPTFYKEGNDGGNDDDNDDIDEMYTDVITDDENNVTNGGETAKSEHNMDKNNGMYIMEPMDDNNDLDDTYDPATTTGDV